MPADAQPFAIPHRHPCHGRRLTNMLIELANLSRFDDRDSSDGLLSVDTITSALTDVEDLA